MRTYLLAKAFGLKIPMPAFGFALFIALASSTPAFARTSAAPVAVSFNSAPPSLTMLLGKSHYVFLGHVTEVTNDAGGDQVATIDNIAAVKGSCDTPHIQIRVTDGSPYASLFGQVIFKDETALFFLNNFDNCWVPADARFFLPVRSGSDVKGKCIGAGVAIVDVLLYTASDPTALSAAEKLRVARYAETVKDAAKSGAKEGPPPYIPQTLSASALDEIVAFPLGVPEIKKLMALMASSDPNSVRYGQIMVALLYNEPHEILASAVAYVHAGQQASPPETYELRSERSAVANAIGGLQITDGTPELVKLLSDPDLAIRKGGMGAISNTIDLELYAAPEGRLSKKFQSVIVPAMISCLDDPDSGMRFRAVCELPPLTRNFDENIPRYSVFDKNYKQADELPAITYWKTWWYHHAAEYTADTPAAVQAKP